MTKASDNAFPSVLLTEGGPPSAPATGKQRLWTNSSNLNMITATGAMRVIGGGGTSSGGLAQSYIGYNTAGGSNEAPAASNTKAFLKQVTLSSAAEVLSIGAYLHMESLAGLRLIVGVWTDSAGAPATLLAMGSLAGDGVIGHATKAPGWYDFPLGAHLASGTYWIGIFFSYQATGWRIYYDGSGSDVISTMANAGYIGDCTSNAAGSNKYSIRASILS